MSQLFELTVEGMHCGACVRRVKAALAQVPGVAVEEVEVGRVKGAADGPIEAVAAAVTAAGYPAAVRAPA